MNFPEVTVSKATKQMQILSVNTPSSDCEAERPYFKTVGLLIKKHALSK